MLCRMNECSIPITAPPDDIPVFLVLLFVSIVDVVVRAFNELSVLPDEVIAVWVVPLSRSRSWSWSWRVDDTWSISADDGSSDVLFNSTDVLLLVWGSHPKSPCS